MRSRLSQRTMNHVANRNAYKTDKLSQFTERLRGPPFTDAVVTKLQTRQGVTKLQGTNSSSDVLYIVVHVLAELHR